MAESKLTVAYWGIQSLAHPTRLLLHYFNVPFEDKLFMDRDEWFTKEKPALDTPFKTIPYIKDGDLVITESSAVIQYAAHKTGNKDLLGKNDLDYIKIYQLWSVLKDLSNSFMPIAWDKDFEKIKEETLKTKTTPILDKLSKALGEQEYPMGYLTWVDFYFVFLLDVIHRMDPDTIAAHPNLVKYHSRIYSNEGIQAYRKSEKYPKFFLPPMVTWPGEEKI